MGVQNASVTTCDGRRRQHTKESTVETRESLVLRDFTGVGSDPGIPSLRVRPLII